ncbi:glycine-rich domain-containing protein [Caenispirillum bisanense]|nr:hypothetical protein [Caenispirillum bisanense]
MSQAMALVEQDDALKAALAKVAELDFTMLKTKVCRDENMTAEECDEIDDLYRKFLALNMRYPDRKICPTGPIDVMWHYHILDTRAYERDCMALFGRLLHHFPYFGMRGEQDKQDLERTFEESVALFVSHFGIDPTRGDTMARSCRSQNCP